MVDAGAGRIEIAFEVGGRRDGLLALKARFPDAYPLRVNQLSAREGGWLRPHKSHQNGRDVDLGFYYPTEEPVRVRERERYIDEEAARQARAELAERQAQELRRELEAERRKAAKADERYWAEVEHG